MVLSDWARLASVLLVVGASGRSPAPEESIRYGSLVSNRSNDFGAWSAASSALREWMIGNDPHYPRFHFTAPEGWINDPNGVTWDPKTGLYHRFFQYGPGRGTPANKDYATDSIVWGHSVAPSLAGPWADWPVAFWNDVEGLDDLDVFSGNCVVDDDGFPTCVYTGVALRVDLKIFNDTSI